MKTGELTGALLDYWVAKAEGHSVTTDAGHCWLSKTAMVFEPSTSWAQGGPLIDKYELSLIDKPYLAGTEHGKNGIWMAYKYGQPLDSAIFGETPLVAICRAVVRSVYDDEVLE